MAGAAAAEWRLATISDPAANPWDVCHRLVTGQLGFGGAQVEFAEPDIEQRWLWTDGERPLALADEEEEACKPEPQDSDVYATFEDGASFDDDNHSQLASARAAVGVPSERIRIAHLDTGFDPTHTSLPLHLRADMQKNFFDAGRENDATDLGEGPNHFNFGHGTSTLALLAGKYADGMPLGGAAYLDVIPIRVANIVVLFRSSSVARALDYVHGLWDNLATRVHVVTMSMGGLASAAWADAVNALYEQGIFVVTAAGNNIADLPTRFTVYPARFQRVVAANGVMANGAPYADFPALKRKLAGCYGPRRKEDTSLAAYTPNVPWARIHCHDLINKNGNGTSAATPQIAAAAALWIQQHRAGLEGYPEGWMRVEAVRKALFGRALKEDTRHFGQGRLRASDSLAVAPAVAAALQKQPEDRTSFALLRVITGLGAAEDAITPRQRMIELEALQLSQRSGEIEDLLGDLDVDDPVLQRSPRGMRILEALGAAPAASAQLKQALHGLMPSSVAVPGGAAAPPAPAVAPRALFAAARAVTPSGLPVPQTRPLRVYAFDPAAAMDLDTLAVHQAVIEVRWEELAPGPVGEYLEVVDIDPASQCAYDPVDLNHPHVLAQRGLEPADGSPQFHQQMVYGVAMRTIQHFERALGRCAQWAERVANINGIQAFRFVRRLRIYPHALREENAYYSPERRALLFGYFNARLDNSGNQLPGGLVFTCLSHDIVAHETVHALLDGLHPHYKEQTNPDMPAFHEAFADIVALFQHFSLQEAVRHQIAASRGDLTMAQLLGGLAAQFGQATGRRGTLRNYIAIRDPKTKKWIRREPSRDDYDKAKESHQRGAVLVGAVFDAFLAIYSRKTADLMRLATNGTGVLPRGAIPHDLVELLAKEASKIAGRVLEVCIRALDYCPPVDLTFGEYLRALITADRDLVPDDPKDYRVAFVSAFRARGIYPPDVSNLSVGGLIWRPPEHDLRAVHAALWAIEEVDWTVSSDRYMAYLSANHAARQLSTVLKSAPAEELEALGLHAPGEGGAVTLDGVRGQVSALELHSVRPVRRVAPDGDIRRQTVIEILQRWKPTGGDHRYLGGCTLICDSQERRIFYVIRKRVGHPQRLVREDAHQEVRAMATPYANYFDMRKDPPEPFAFIHREEATEAMAPAQEVSNG